jgi:hypothetical protein
MVSTADLLGRRNAGFISAGSSDRRQGCRVEE